MSNATKMTEHSDLSPEQQKVVESWGQGLAVMAGAGSGKTTTLVIKCAELLKRKPDARFAAVSFTERSASDLREKLSARLSLTNEGSALSGHWVATIHGLCGSIIREYPREAGYDGEESILSEPEANLLWERAMDSIWVEDLPPDVLKAVESLMVRESRDSMQDLLRRLRQLESFGALESLRSQGDQASQALEVVGRYVLDRYERLKRRRGVLDFGDLEAGADRALRNEAVCEAYRQRFDLVLVDEFQDTNPVQARIIWRIVRTDLSNLCIVGDPKQSIYRFRDADVSVFEDCCSKLPVRLSLTWNFRSRPGVIHFANEVCGRAFPASQMSYEALIPKREALEGMESVVRLDVRHPSELGAFVRGELDKGVALHDMALLMKRIRGNEVWLKALTSAGIPIAIGSGGLFWEDPRVRELTSFLKWWDNSGNALSGAVFLRAPWVGIPDMTLDGWIRKDPGLKDSFFASEHLLARALAPLRDQVVRPGELLMALLVNEELEAELGAPLLGLWHRCEELSSRGLDFHAVVSELALSMEQNRRERDVPPPRNQGQLMVLTIHGSKGLEFPHVILIDFPDKPGKAANAPLLFWDREQGAYLASRTESGERDKKNPVEDRWRTQEKAKDLAESKRLFYVALTRARERLILVHPAATAPAKPAAKAPKVLTEEEILEKDFWRGWIEVSGVKIPGLEVPLASDEVSAPDLTFKAGLLRELKRKPALLHRPRHSVTEWNTLARCSRAYEWGFIRPILQAEGIAEIGLFTGVKTRSIAEDEMSQKDLGSAVHKCLETGDFDGLKALEGKVGETRFSAEPVISWAMSSPLMAPEKPARNRRVWAELAFELNIAGENLVGSIDRLVREDGPEGPHYSIVDFKVTEKPKSVEALIESYQHQLMLYAWALHRLEPESRGKTDALIVNISSRAIQTLHVPLDRMEDPMAGVESLAQSAAEIVSGKEGIPTPGPLCRVCEFRSRCKEGSASL